MNVVIASDHRGYGLKSRVIVLLKEQGHQVTDMGVNDSNSCDYTDVAFPAAHAVATGEADLGVLIDGNGIGMSMAANKVKGVRAALCHDELTAEMSRAQNDSNILCLPGDVLGDELIRRILSTWLSAEFDGSGRHERRVQKLAMIEEGQDPRETE